MWVTWSNQAVNTSGTVDGTTELSVDLDLKMYAVQMDTGSGDIIDAISTPGATYGMIYYLQFANPYLSATSPNTTWDNLKYDAMVADITITTGSGAGKDTAVFNWTTTPSDLSTK